MMANLNVQSNAIVDVNVSTWLENEKDSITLAVGFAQLPDGASYTNRSVLDAKSKNISVVVKMAGTVRFKDQRRRF